MKKNYFRGLLAIGLMAVSPVFAQTDNVGIGTNKPDPSAVLDLNSANKGLLMPRMSSAQRLSIAYPAQGLMVYQTGKNSGFYFFEGNVWKPINQIDAEMAMLNPEGWSIGGNSGTNPSTHFLGTSDNTPLSLRINNLNAGVIPTQTGNKSMFLGSLAGNANTGSHNVGLGTSVLRLNGAGSYNVGLGSFALENNSGDENTAIGYSALISNTTGNFNMAIGSGALQSNVGGSRNMAFGANSANKIDGSTSDVIAIGSNALRYGTGGSNVAIGTNAGRGPGIGANSGIENVMIGKDAGIGNTTGARNTYVGAEAGYTNSTGNDNIFIGYRAGTNEVNPSGKLFISNSATALPLIYGNFSANFVAIGDVPASLRESANTSGGYKLLVRGGILTEKVKVALASPGLDWADYVFEPSYKSKMMKLEDIEQFTITNKHLPNVPSAEEMVKNGLDVSQTSKMFMEKIEELTLYMIEMNKEIKALKAENAKLKK